MSAKWRPEIGQRVEYIDDSGIPMIVVSVNDVSPEELEYPGDPPRYAVWVKDDDGDEGWWWSEDLKPSSGRM